MFWDVFERLCKEKGIEPGNACLQMGFGNSQATHWKQGSKPHRKNFAIVAEFFGYTVDELKNLITKEADLREMKELGFDHLAKSYEEEQEMRKAAGLDNLCEVSRARRILNYRFGEAESTLMLLPFIDRMYLPADAVSWIAARCQISENIFYSERMITLEYLDSLSEVIDLDASANCLSDPRFAKYESEYIWRKFETDMKYLNNLSEIQKNTPSGFKAQIIQDFMELIDQFAGDIGSQFALLDRCRQSAKQLMDDVCERKESASS